MAITSLDRIRVDQVGSLAPTPALRNVFERFKKGAAGASELAAAQDMAIKQSIARQQAIGMPILTDGELRRQNFQESFGAAVSGFDVGEAFKQDFRPSAEKRPLKRAEQDFEAAGPAIYSRRAVTERLKLVNNVPLSEYQAASAVAKSPVKVAVLSADRISQRYAHEDPRSKSVYRDLDAFMADVVAINRQIVQSLVDAGCRYIQIDAPGYTAYVDDVSLQRMRSRGEEPEVNLDRSIKADNAIIEGFSGVTFGIHLCRGNPRTIDPETGKVMPQWHREGHYDGIAERLFSTLNHQRLLLEYDSERAGSFAPLRFVPKDKVAVLGLVTTKSADLEPVDHLRRRIDEAGRHLPLEQLALSPQCGFGGVNSITITPDEQWAKLERICETAHKVWA